MAKKIMLRRFRRGATYVATNGTLKRRIRFVGRATIVGRKYLLFKFARKASPYRKHH